MSLASVDALPLIHPTFSAINLGLRDLSRVGDLQIIPFIGVKKSSFPENL
jgi:hypothetical protein